MTAEKKSYSRANRTLGLDEAIGSALDPVLRKRGFANRDLIANWTHIAPAPYNQCAIPDKIHWPRSTANAEGATLYLRCAESHKLALMHEGAQLAASINRYFGYVLIGSVKLSPMPFSPGSDAGTQIADQPSETVRRKVESTVATVENEELREALRRLGEGLMSRKR